MNKKVLVIDNNPDIDNFIRERLKEKGFDVIIAGSGDEGVSKARSISPDVILLDMLSTDFDGFEVLKQLKDSPETADIPVILDSMVENMKEKGLEMGAVDYISKPIDYRGLYDTVTGVLKKFGKGLEQAVLVIDDDINLVEMLKDFLESKNIKAIGATSGREGLTLAREENIGLILLDLSMPEMDGYGVIRKLKSDSAVSEIPVIVVTSVDLKESRDKCLMLGADRCFSKPFDREMLMDTVNSMLEREEKKEDSLQYGNAKVLVADDEESILEMVRDTLELEGYEVIAAKDGQEALDRIYSDSPDILVLDVRMPKLNGYEVCQKIRQDVLMSNLPIIMLTAKSSETDEIKGLELGVDDYITKPFRPAVFLTRLRSALARTQSGLNVNPLTYLPGNTAIARQIESRLRAEDNFAVLYVDLDRFKAYNDYYGFHKGDEIIKATARILVNTVKKMNPGSGFIGHIGGDDFICIIDDDNIDKVCEEIINEFDSAIKGYYNQEDIDKGYIFIENRKGEKEKTPLMAISIGAVTTARRNFSHIGEISKLGAELKKFAKKKEQSNYVLDRRVN